MVDLQSVIDEVKRERARQDKTWGTQNHHPFVWLSIIGEEYGECHKALLAGSLSKYREELIHVAASCIAAIQALDEHGIPEG